MVGGNSRLNAPPFDFSLFDGAEMEFVVGL